MQTEIIKSNLREYYNKEAPLRNFNDKDEWKISQRSDFCNLIKSENKKTLLEIGAGTGDDSVFFMKSGLKVTAVDLSPEMVRICIEKSIEAYELDFYKDSVSFESGYAFDTDKYLKLIRHENK